jgi:ABC-type glycerol-3-phosphate transport system permease component
MHYRSLCSTISYLPLLSIQKKEYMPIPAGLYEFIGYQTIKWNEMMAASLVGIAPVLIIFIFFKNI